LVVFSLEATNILGKNTEDNLLAAMVYQVAHPCHVIVFTGGVFSSHKGQTRPAASMMYEFWHHHFEIGHEAGLNLTPRVLEEGESRTTRQNVLNILKILREKGYSPKDAEIIVVSEKWHLRGIAALFRGHGIRVEQIRSEFRESWRGVIGRIIRLAIYRTDPHGTHWLSRRVIKQRGG
jgi:hypothetical protein